MDVLIILVATGLILAGLAGCLIPILPGPPLSFLALLLIHFTKVYHFESGFLILWGAITLVVTIVDFLIPVWGARKFGASKAGVWGTFLGLLAGIILFPPLGIIIGPIAGAIAGELIAGKKSRQAMIAGLGSFTGFMGGIVLKIISSGIMTYHFILAVVSLF